MLWCMISIVEVVIFRNWIVAILARVSFVDDNDNDGDDDCDCGGGGSGGGGWVRAS